uniref:Uncharacterized protein n=1 Tax=Anguilla anguilla TaxID=7936 RepID=A0A0E9XLE8_ANGAN
MEPFSRGKSYPTAMERGGGPGGGRGVMETTAFLVFNNNNTINPLC